MVHRWSFSVKVIKGVIPKKKDTKIPQSSGPTEPIVAKAVNEENVPTHSNDPQLSGEDGLKLKELIVVSSKDEGLGEGDVSKQWRINAIDADEDIYLVNVPRDEVMFGVNDLEGDEVVVESDVAAKKKDDEVNVVEEVVGTAGDAAPVSAATITTVEFTLAQTLAELRSARPKAKGLVIPKQEPSESITTTTTKTTTGILLQEPSETRTTTTPVIPLKDKEAIRLQAQFDKEERIAREKEEVNAALIAKWNDIQDKVETDYELAQRLQAEEQEELTDAEKATLFVQLLEERKKHFTAKRAEEKRNRPPTKAQLRSIMCTYLKNIAGWKPKDLKNKSFATIQDLFDKAIKRVNTFVDMDTKLLEGGEVRVEGNETREESSSKRARDELESDKSKKQKLDEKVEAEVDDAKEAKELKQCLEIVPDDGDDVTINATPLSVKIPIVDYKIHQEGKKSFFQIIRADGNSQMYLTFTKMLKNFDREDLEVLWRIVKARFKKTDPVNYMDNFLLLNFKTMFEHHVEDGVWNNQQGLKSNTKEVLSTDDSLKYPPGFTPREDVETDVDTSKQRNISDREAGVVEPGSKTIFSKEEGTEFVCSGHFKKSETPRSGGSIILLMDELVKETKKEPIELFDIQRCWGNFVFDYVHSDSVGNSGGILCVWDPNSFKKINASVSDYFVMIRGHWVTNGEVIIMGDFNEVRKKNERFGSAFNVQGGNAFNSFIASAGLEEVPLGGCSFTWCHKSASKMSKLDRFLISKSLMSSSTNISAITLDRYLSEHRPILLCEAKHDYGPIPF
ncbi:putative ribonuclease H-like domain-containing protein [Tanacetum coccineum]